MKAKFGKLLAKKKMQSGTIAGPQLRAALRRSWRQEQPIKSQSREIRRLRWAVIARAVSGVAEQRCWRVRATERLIVAHVDPGPPRVGLALGQHRHRRVVAMQTFCRQHVRLDQRAQRLQCHGTRAHLVGQRQDAEIDPLPGVAVPLPVQGLASRAGESDPHALPEPEVPDPALDRHPEPGLAHPLPGPPTTARRLDRALQRHARAHRDLRRDPALHRRALQGVRLDPRRNYPGSRPIRPPHQTGSAQEGRLASAPQKRLAANSKPVTSSPTVTP